MKLYKRILSLVITLALVIGMIPMSAITANAFGWGMFDGGTVDAGETATITCYSGGVVVTNFIFESRGTTIGKLTHYDDDGVLVYEEDILGSCYHGWTYCSGTYIIEVYYGAIDIQWNGANGGVPTITFEQNNLKMDYLIKPNMSTIYLSPGETQELFIQDVYPGYEAELRDECFESNNSSIASVTEDGLITANQEGETQIDILYTFTSAAGNSIQLSEPCDVIVVDDTVNKETGLRFYYSDEEIEPGDTVWIGAGYSFGDFTGMYYPGTVEWQLSNENVLKVIQTVDNVTMIRVEALAIGKCELSLVLDGEVKCTETINVTLTDDTLIKDYKDYLMNCAVMTTLSDARDTCWDVIGRYSSGSRTRIAFMTCLKEDLGLSVITKEGLAALGITSSTHQDTVDEAIDLLMTEICSSEEAWFSDGLSTFKKRYKTYGAFTKTTAFADSSFEYSLAQFTSFSEEQINSVSGVAKGFVSDSISMAELVSAAVMTVQYERDVVVSLMNTVAAAPGGTSSDLYKGLERLLWEMDNLDVYVAHRYLNNKMVGSLQSLIEDGLFYSDDNFKMFDSTVWKVATGMGKLIALAYENEGGVFADDYMKACVTSGFASTLYYALMNSDSASELEYSFKFYVPAVKVALNSAIGICDDAIVNCRDLKGIAEGYLLQIEQTCTYENLLAQCRMAVKGASDYKANVYIENDEIVVDAYWELPETNALMLTDEGAGDFYTTGYTADQLIIVPSHINGEKVTGIATNGFKGIANKYGIVLPDSVVRIGEYAFSDCPQATFVVLGDNLKEIGAYAFNNNYALQAVSLPSSLEIIKEGAFTNCYNISSIITEAGQIDSKAFYNCTSLSSITIKNKNAVIAADAFDNCSSELTIYGYKNTDAEEIATAKGYTFVELSETVSMIEIATPATKTEYKVGEPIDTTDMTLNVTYMDGTSEVITDGWIAHGDTSASGESTVKIYYGEKIATYTITVKEAEVISVELEYSEITMLFGGDMQISAQVMPNTSKNVNIVWSSSDPNVVRVDMNGFVEAVGTGTATITAKALNSSVSSTCTVTVIDTKRIDPSIEKTDYITFTARENGYYVFYSIGSGKNITGSILDINGNTLYSNYGTNFRVEGQLHKDKTYTFKTTTSSSNNAFDVVINKSVDAKSLSIKDAKGLEIEDVVSYPNDTKSLSYGFTPVNYITETCTWESSDTSVVTVDKYGKLTMVAPGTATVTLTSEKGLTDSCNVTVNRFTDAPGINVDDIKTVNITETDERIYFSFTPEVDGWYALYSISNSNDNTCCYLLDSDGMSLASSSYGGEGNNFRLECELTAGETYIYMCDFYYSSTTGIYDVKLEKMLPPTSISINEGDALTKYVKESLNLTIEYAPQYSIEETITWESSNEAVATVTSQGKVTMVSPGETIITATSENGLTDECVITVLDYPTIGVGEHKTVEIDDDFKNRYFYFTPEKDGTYVFYSISNSDTYGYLLNSSGSTLKTDDQSGEGSNFRIEYALTGGETYVLRCKYYYSSTNGSFDVCVYELVDAEYVQITEGDSFTGYVESQHTLSAELLPMISRDQSMTWTSTDDTTVSVDQNGEINLLKPGSATITVTTESGLTDSIVVTVKDFSDISVGSTNTVEITEKDPSISFKFTPTESGWYSFYSNSDSDTYCRLFNSSGDELTNDDNSGENNNFRIDYQLEAGETYIFRCSYSFSGVLGTYDVKLEKGDTDLGDTLELDKEYQIYSESTTLSTFVADSTGFYKITVIQRDKDNYPDIYDNINIDVAPNSYHAGYSKGYSQNGYYIYEDTNVYYFEANKESYITVTSNGALPTKLTINKVPDPTSVSLSLTTLSFTEGDYGQSLYVTLSPEYTYGKYTWESSNETVATVNEHGFVKPVGAGEATITVSVNGTQLSASCNVSVEGVEKTKMDISKPYTNLEVGVYYVQTSESGYYKFVFNDCYMDINDSQYNQLGWLNSSYNMACKYLEAGQMYILEITSTYNNGAYGEIQPVSAPTNITIDNDIILTPGTLKTFYISTDDSDTYFDHASSTFVIENPEIARVTSINSRGNITQWSQFYEAFFTVEGLKIGETTLTVTTKDGCSYTFPVVVEDYSSIIDGANIDLTLGKNGNAIYTFTPEESASYTLEASGTQGCSIYIRDENNNYLTGIGDNYADSNHYVSVTYDFEEGTTYFVELEGDFLYTANYNFKLNKTVAANELLLNIDTITGYVGDTYDLRYTLLPKHSFKEQVSWQTSDSSIVTVDEQGHVVFVASGDATITATSENGLVAICTITVKSISEITCDQEVRLTTDIDSGVGLYRFTPEVDGTYVFYSYDNTIDTYGYIFDGDMQQIDSDDDGGDGNNFSIECFLSAGETYYLKTKPYSSSATGTYSIKVMQLVPATSIEITAGASISRYEGSTYYLSAEFSPDNAITESLTWTSSNTDVATVSYDGYVRFVAAGTATITVTSENGLSDSIEVIVKAPTVMSVGETKTGFADLGCTADIFEFTPTEDGMYRVTVESPNHSYLNIRDSEGNYLANKGGYDMTADQAMTAGSTYRFEMVFADPNLSGNFTIKVEKLVPATGMEIVQGEMISGYEGGGYWSLSVKFAPDNAAPEAVTWTSDAPTVATVDNQGRVSYVAAGTATITATSQNGYTDTITVVVKAYPVLTEETPCDVTIENNEDVYIRFVPETSGNYRIYYTNLSYDGNRPHFVLEQNNSWLKQGDEYLDCYLEADTEYLIGTWFSSYSPPGNGSYTVCIAEIGAAESVQIDQGDTASGFKGEIIHLSATFSPEICMQESVFWTSSNNEVATVAENGRVNMISVGTAIITATSENGLTDTITITVKGYPAIQEGTETDALIDVGGMSSYFSFTPEEDGYYAFYASTDSDTLGYIMDEELNILASDDDNGEGYNFKVKYQMEAGKTYILKARYYGSEETGTIKVCVEKTRYIASLEVTALPTRLDYVKEHVYNISYKGLKLKATWSDGSVSNWSCNSDGYFNNMIEDEYISFDTDNCETSGEIIISCGGQTTSFHINLVDNPVDHIEVVSLSSHKYVENYNGYEMNGGGYYYYANTPTDAVIKIVYLDGSSVTANVGDVVDYYSIGWEHNQYDKAWAVGTENESTVTYLGHTVNLPITVEENKVESIEVVSGKVTCIENAYGYDMGNGYYYYYSVPSDVTVKVNYTDGSSITTNIHDEIDGYSFNWTTDQYSDPWTLGDDNYVTISYLGVTGKLPVSVIASPVERIEINTAPTREYIYGDSEWGWLYSDGGYEFYPSDMTGISFTVYYTDGTTKTFTSADIDNQDLINGYGYSLSYDEYVSEPGDFPVMFSYMGKSAEYTIKLKESTVESLSVTKLPSTTQFGSYFSPDFVGTEFTITFTDGSTKTVILTESNLEYEYDWDYGLTYKVDVDGNTLSIRPIYAESGRYYRAYYIDQNVEIRDFTFVDSQDVTSVVLGNVTSLGDNMNVIVTYDDGSTDNLSLDVAAYNDYGDEIEGYAKTAKGLLYYNIYTKKDAEDNTTGYEVYIFGQTIECEAADVIVGDINNDGVVDLLDRMVLSRYLANWDGYTAETINMQAADVNGDGVVDPLDRMVFSRYLANWDDYTTLPYAG